MPYEVEMKFALADRQAFEQSLASLGAVERGVQHQEDVYLAHPCRDFAATDEAFRIRQSGQNVLLTYKGPKLDATTKTRREIEIDLGPADQLPARLSELFEALGFRTVARVRKQRRLYRLSWQGRDVSVALDEVEGLGAYVELELVADQAQLEATRSAVVALAQQMQLSGSERRSYLELLLKRQS